MTRALKGIIIRIIVRLRRGNLTGRVVKWDIRAALCVEIDGGHLTELSQGIAHGGGEDLPDGLFVLKLDLRLRGMDVHVDIVGIHLEVQEIRHLHPFRNQTVIGGDNRFMEIGVFHVTAVHEEIVLAALLTSPFRFADESGNAAHGRVHLHRQQILAVLAAEHVADALMQTACLEVQHLRAVMMEGEMDVGIYEYDPFESRQDITQFGGIRFQELPAGRDIKEEVLHLEVTAHRTGYGLL